MEMMKDNRYFLFLFENEETLFLSDPPIELFTKLNKCLVN